MKTQNKSSLITVIFVGSHDHFRESLADLISIQTDMELVDTVSTHREITDQVSARQPDVILIDLSISEMESLLPIQKIQQASPCTHIIAMSGFPRKELIDNMMQSGVKRYIKRGDSALSIVDAIRDVCQMAKEE